MIPTSISPPVCKSVLSLFTKINAEWICCLNIREIVIMIEPCFFGFLSFWIKSNYPRHREKWSVCFRRRDSWSPPKTKKSRMWKVMLIFKSKWFFICWNWMVNPFYSIQPPPEKALELPKEWLTTDLEEQNSSKWGEKVDRSEFVFFA